MVTNGQRIAKGDVLFRIENSSQTASLAQAEAEIGKILAAESKAQDTLKVAQANVTKAKASREKIKVDLEKAQILLDKKVTTEEAVRDL